MKNLRELTTEAQTWCHNGESDAEVYVKILDGYYKVKDLQKLNSADKTVFVIETEV